MDSSTLLAMPFEHVRFFDRISDSQELSVRRADGVKFFSGKMDSARPSVTVPDASKGLSWRTSDCSDQLTGCPCAAYA